MHIGTEAAAAATDWIDLLAVGSLFLACLAVRVCWCSTSQKRRGRVGRVPAAYGTRPA